MKAPAGLDLGRTSHKEIAVAILAELVQLRAAGALGAATAAEVAAAKAPAEATDPVCGMTVAAGASSHPFEHDGVTYYFCRVGCRQEFEKNPAAFVKRETRC